MEVSIKRGLKWKTFQHLQDAKPMMNQVGGHHNTQNDTKSNRKKKGVLRLAPEYALKPLGFYNKDDYRGIREVAFYESIKNACNNEYNNNKNNNNEIVSSWFSAFVWQAPQKISISELAAVASQKRMKRDVQILRRFATVTAPYYGVIGLESQEKFLLMSDLTVNFSKPCVIDIKIGCKSYEPDATLQKIEYELNKYKYQEAFGFRIVGMRVYDPTHADCDEAGYRFFDKQYGRSLTTHAQIVNAFKIFFQQASIHNVEQIIQDFVSKRGGDNMVSKYDVDELRQKLSSTNLLRSRVITNLTPQILRIRKCFEENDLLCFISSSILIVYEGDITAENPDRATVKMIDFGHVRRQAGGDSSYLYGIKKVLQVFASLQHNHTPAIENISQMEK